MQLDNITQQACPHCGSIAVSERKEDRHTNGHWNETRTFECGVSMKYSPNFRRVEQQGQCTKSPAYQQKVKARRAIHQAILNHIDEECGEDIDFASRLKHNIRCCNY